MAAAIYSTILTNKLSSITPGTVAKAALAAGLPPLSLPTLLTEYSTNLTAVPGINPAVIVAVDRAIAEAAAASFRYPSWLPSTESAKLY